MYATPLLITLAPAEAGAVRIPGFDALSLDPFRKAPSSCRVPLAELEDAAAELIRSLQALPEDRPVALYGEGAWGTLTVFTLGRTGRISAAAVQGALVDPLSALALTDAVPPEPEEDIQSGIHSLAEDCALEEIRAVRAPLLILQGERDGEVPAAQADELFVLMKAVHPELPSRLVLFPGEGHRFTAPAREAALKEIGRFLTNCLGGEEKP